MLVKQLTFCLLFSSLFLNAQEEKERFLSITYLGEFITHPGFEVSYAQAFKQISKFKKEKEIKYSFAYTTSLGNYIHYGSHFGSIVEAGIKRLKSKGKKCTRIVEFEIGYFRQFNLGETYIIQENGSAEKRLLTSRGYLLPSFSIGFASDIHKEQPIQLYSALKIGGQLPYNTTIIPRVFLNIGITYKLSSNEN